MHFCCTLHCCCLNKRSPSSSSSSYYPASCYGVKRSLSNGPTLLCEVGSTEEEEEEKEEEEEELGTGRTDPGRRRWRNWNSLRRKAAVV